MCACQSVNVKYSKVPRSHAGQETLQLSIQLALFYITVATDL